MNLQENISTQLRRRTHLLDRIIDNLLPNMYPCDYNSSDHFVEGVLDEIRWFLLDVEELKGIERMDIKNYILDYKYDELTEYFNERCVVLKNDNLQETIKRVLREELSPRVRRRVDPYEMEKEFLESFESANNLTKRRKVLSTHFLDELIYTTISMMMDGFHWRFTSTLPEDEFWYDDIHTELENHYRDRIIQMYNERQGIKESILREESKPILMIRRRVPYDDLEREFSESLDMSSNMLRNTNKEDGSIMSLNRFIDVTISILMDGIHHELYNTMPEDSQWYGEVIESLKNYYKDRIKHRYKKLVSNI